jgi:choice-of-anchor A domain-containing protein
LQAAKQLPERNLHPQRGGSGTQTIVVNIPTASAFNGSVVLTGGPTSDQVLFNFIAANYSTLSGGGSATTTGTFLDPNGNIQINHSLLGGRIFGGDTQNISGDNIFLSLPLPGHRSSPARLC